MSRPCHASCWFNRGCLVVLLGCTIIGAIGTGCSPAARIGSDGGGGGGKSDCSMPPPGIGRDPYCCSGYSCVNGRWVTSYICLCEPDTLPPIPTCGNGILDPGEQCDDGNTTDGDGCSRQLCQVEAGWTCPTPGQPCTKTSPCKNGIANSNETCDGGRTVDGDGPADAMSEAADGCGDSCCGDPCCGGSCEVPDPCGGDPCCGDPCCGDPCCGSSCEAPDPCGGDPCCGDPCCGDPCCGGSCEVPDPCGGDPCCGDPCCGDPCCGDPCCGDPCCGDACCGDPCCGDCSPDRSDMSIRLPSKFSSINDRAAYNLVCSSDQVALENVGNHRYLATGCGKTAYYRCACAGEKGLSCSAPTCRAESAVERAHR